MHVYVCLFCLLGCLCCSTYSMGLSTMQRGVPIDARRRDSGKPRFSLSSLFSSLLSLSISSLSLSLPSLLSSLLSILLIAFLLLHRLKLMGSEALASAAFLMRSLFCVTISLSLSLFLSLSLSLSLSLPFFLLFFLFFLSSLFILK